MRNYKKLEVWNLSKERAIDLYQITINFPKEEVYGLTNQIKRSSISIPANIAEGNGKNSDAELNKFLKIAMGSASELETLLIIANELNYLKKDDFRKLNQKLEIIKKMINSFLNRIKATSNKPPATS